MVRFFVVVTSGYTQNGDEVKRCFGGRPGLSMSFDDGGPDGVITAIRRNDGSPVDLRNHSVVGQFEIGRC
jgi:hypothetical protein